MEYSQGETNRIDKNNSVKNPMFSKLTTSDNYLPSSTYTSYDVTQRIRHALDFSEDVLFFPEYTDAKVQTIKTTTTEKGFTPHLSREIVGTREINFLANLKKIGFKKHDDNGVVCNNRDVYEKLLQRHKSGEVPMNCLVVVNRKIYRMTY